MKESFCENCGAKTEADDQFCESCGFDTLKALKINKKISKKKKFVVPLLSIVLLATLINGYSLIIKHYELKDFLKTVKVFNTAIEKRLNILSNI